VTDADDERLLLTGLERFDDRLERRGRLFGVPGRADRPRIAVGSEPGGRGEVQLRSGRNDQIVVGELFFFTGSRRIRVDDVDEGPGVTGVTLGWIATAFAWRKPMCLRL